MNATQPTVDATGVTSGDWRESRAAGGIEVSLLWSRGFDRVKVTVADTKLADEFELDVTGADALAAFYHPFVYAAGRGACSGQVEREPLNLQSQS